MYSCITIFTLVALAGQFIAVCHVEADRPGFHRDLVDNPTIRRSVLAFSVSRALNGYKATRKLLKGTHPILSQVKGTSRYVKDGNLKTALRDMEEVSTTNVRNLALPDGIDGWRGMVGDRVITVEHSPKTGLTTMKIVKGIGTKKQRSNHIIYLGKDQRI